MKPVRTFLLSVLPGLLASPPAWQQAVEGGRESSRGPSRVDAYGDPLPDGAVRRLGTLRYRGDAELTCVALSPDGRLLALGGDRSVKVVDAETGKERYRLAVESPPRELACLPGEHGVIIGWDRKVVLWDFRADKERNLPIPGARVMLGSLTVSAGGSVAAGTWDRDPDSPADAERPGLPVIVWDIATAREVVTVTTVHKGAVSAALSGEGKTLATWDGSFERSQRDETLQLW